MMAKHLSGIRDLRKLWKSMFPSRVPVPKLSNQARRLFVGAYGFEDRSLGWARYQASQGHVLDKALILRYVHPKGRNRVKELRLALKQLGVTNPVNLRYDVHSPYNIEQQLPYALDKLLDNVDEVVVDISAMTKLLILVVLYSLSRFDGAVRVVYSEAENYAPTREYFERWKNNMEMMTGFPSRGVESIVRIKCLSSTRMQGQPVTMVAFTSFNEQLVRHMLGSINPHRLIFINGRSPRKDFAWREKATQEIHRRSIQEYREDNPIGEDGLLERVTSLIDYFDTTAMIDEVHKQFGSHERIICATTGSKMQTVGLFFTKMMHPDIHIEYPTPDSYFVKEKSKGVQQIYEVNFPLFSKFLEHINLK